MWSTPSSLDVAPGRRGGLAAACLRWRLVLAGGWERGGSPARGWVEIEVEGTGVAGSVGAGSASRWSTRAPFLPAGTPWEDNRRRSRWARRRRREAGLLAICRLGRRELRGLLRRTASGCWGAKAEERVLEQQQASNPQPPQVTTAIPPPPSRTARAKSRCSAGQRRRRPRLVLLRRYW